MAVLVFLRLGILIMIIAFSPVKSEAKSSNGQNQIILLNDSAAALEDSDPGLSKTLSSFADEKEKEWEESNANKDAAPKAITDKDIPKLREQIRILKEASVAIQPMYPLIAEGLKKMTIEIANKIEVKQSL